MSNYELPRVAVLLPTYERPEVLKQTVELLRQNLDYEGQLQILIADDSKEPSQEKWNNGRVGGIKWWVNYEHNGSQFGLGKNLNWLLSWASQLDCDYVIQQDDDHWLIKELDITPHVKKLMDDPTAGAIRLMGIGGHHYTATLDGGMCWRIDWNSRELYIASNRPHLKSISRFHGTYGFYPENEKLGVTEEKFCHTCIDTARLKYLQGFPTVDVLIPLDVMTESSWQHNEHHGAISWQARGF